MAEEKREEVGQVPDELASNITQLADFLDPHLPEAAKTDDADHWPATRAAAFIVGLSLFLWGIIFTVIHYVHRFLILRGRH